MTEKQQHSRRIDFQEYLIDNEKEISNQQKEKSKNVENWKRCICSLSIISKEYYQKLYEECEKIITNQTEKKGEEQFQEIQKLIDTLQEEIETYNKQINEKMHMKFLHITKEQRKKLLEDSQSLEEIKEREDLKEKPIIFLDKEVMNMSSLFKQMTEEEKIQACDYVVSILLEPKVEKLSSVREETKPIYRVTYTMLEKFNGTRKRFLHTIQSTGITQKVLLPVDLSKEDGHLIEFNDFILLFDLEEKEKEKYKHLKIKIEGESNQIKVTEMTKKHEGFVFSVSRKGSEITITQEQGNKSDYLEMLYFGINKSYLDLFNYHGKIIDIIFAWEELHSVGKDYRYVRFDGIVTSIQNSLRVDSLVRENDIILMIFNANGKENYITQEWRTLRSQRLQKESEEEMNELKKIITNSLNIVSE